MQMGKQSLLFEESPYIISSANIVGTKEGAGPLKDYFDVIGEMTDSDRIHGKKRKVHYRRKH